MKKYLTSCALILLVVTVAQPASAHVVVKPSEVGIGQFQTFTVGVPVEKDIPTTGLKLIIPAGLQHVTPNVKPGWTITTKHGEGDEAEASELEWTGGVIPAGQRDEFVFSAQVPAHEAKLAWQAYQTSQDGSVVAWDQPRSAEQKDFSTSGPFSETKVINDLTAAASASPLQQNNLPLLLSGIAVVLSLIAVGMSFKRQSK